MRRLPVFFLIDVSESMIGDPVENVKFGLNKIIGELKNNPMALETTYISIIIFAGKTETILPLTELLSIQDITELPIGGGTYLGNAMEYLMDSIDKEVVTTTSDRKGDWKPLIFLLTDGIPTDNCDRAIQRWQSHYMKKSFLTAISVEDQADLKILRQFTETILIFNKTDIESYKRFFLWVSSSIEQKSIDIDGGVDRNINIDKIDSEILEKAGDIDNASYIKPDERFAIMLGRCQNTKKPYLMKYKRETSTNYKYIDTYPVTEKYFQLSAEEHKENMVNTEYLDQGFNCPHCHTSVWGKCVCKKLHCLKTTTPINTCPWCNKTLEYRAGNFDISRTEG